MNAAEHPGGLIIRDCTHAQSNEGVNVRNGPED